MPRTARPLPIAATAALLLVLAASAMQDAEAGPRSRRAPAKGASKGSTSPPVDKSRGKITKDGVDHRPLCAEWGKSLGTSTLPSFALVNSYENFVADQTAAIARLDR